MIEKISDNFEGCWDFEARDKINELIDILNNLEKFDLEYHKMYLKWRKDKYGI